MKIDFVIPCRNKAKWVGRAMRSAMDQEHPCRVVVSDQGSTDGSLDAIRRMATIGGRNPVEILRCPVRHYKGMPGFNLHLNWIHEQLDSDVVMVCSADDYVLPGRVGEVAAAFEKSGADFVLSANRFEEEDGTFYGYSPTCGTDGFVSMQTVIEFRLGGSAAQNWTLNFWKKIGGMPLFPGCDMILPHLAAAMGKCWYVNNPTHVYVRHIDPNNTGLESVALAHGNGGAVSELMGFHRMCGVIELLRRAEYITRDEDRAALMADLLEVANSWAGARQDITAKGVAPMSFPMLLPDETDGAFPRAVNQ